MRGMVATVALTGLLAAGLVATAAMAQDTEEEPEAPATGTSEEALVDRLVDIERGLPELPPAAADIQVTPEETFGQLEGDYTGALTELELVSDQARQLFVDADEADGPVADAVALVARGYLRLEEAYGYLSAYEDHDLARPVGASDDDGVATGADTAMGLVTAGITLVDTARLDSLLGYAVLRDTEAADDAEKGLFDAAYRNTQQYLTTARPEAHVVISEDTTGVLVAVERFEDAAPSEARAREVTYVCVPRSMYPVDSPEPLVALAALLAGEELDLLPTADCPDLPSPENVVTTQAG